jgi:hypothetical protein
VKVKYGNYSHADYEATIQIQKENLRSESGLVIAQIQRWTITGKLQADSFSALSTAIRNLEAAYDRENQDIGLYTTAGVATAHRVIASSADYVRVVSPPSFPVGDGGQYVEWRDYSIGLEIRIPSPIAAGSDLESWTETIEVIGDGGPIERYVPVVAGPWPRQTIHAASIVTMTQSGTAKGREFYPIPPNPVAPGQIVRPDGIKFSRTGPSSLSPPRGYSITWAYRMELPAPLRAFPSYPN